jgi:uncharacterized protein (TIGR00730 family)
MNVTVFVGANMGGDQMYLMEVKALGEWIAKKGHRLIYGGGGIGLMGVLADAVMEAGGEVTGIVPEFFLQKGTEHKGLTELIKTATIAERREKMIEMGDAFIAFPGGTGTLEEISDVISQKKLGRTVKPVAILNIEGFYNPLNAMLEKMVEEGFLDRSDLNKVYFAKTVDAATWYMEYNS